MRQLLFDCSFTRLQAKEVGITRVVRKLAGELQNVQLPETTFVPVAYSRRGWHRADDIHDPTEMTDEPSGSIRPLAPLLRLSGNLQLRRLIRNGLPVGAQVLAWWAFSRLTYGKLASRLPEVDIAANDWLVLCDASWNYAIWHNARRAKASGARIVTMIHDLIPLNHPEFCAPLLTRIFGQWLRGALATSDAIICNSRATMNELEIFCRKHSLPCPPLGHFRLGADKPAREREGIDPKERTPGVEREAPYFLVVGSIEPRKNLAVVLDAFDGLWARGVDARLVIAGRPADGADEVVRRIHAHHAFGQKLCLMSNATDSDLDSLYQGALALVFASHAEGFGLPLVEARQRGCMVIASRIPAFSELADAGVVLFDATSADALEKLLLQRLHEQHRTVASMPNFSWKDSALEFQKELLRILPLQADSSLEISQESH